MFLKQKVYFDNKTYCLKITINNIKKQKKNILKAIWIK